MTFEEFLAACASARVVATIDGQALLIGNTVIQFKGDSWAEWFARALIKADPIPVEPEVPGKAAAEIIAQIDRIMGDYLAEIRSTPEATTPAVENIDA